MDRAPQGKRPRGAIGARLAHLNARLSLRRSVRAVGYRISAAGDASSALVFGLTWQTVLGTDLSDAARKTARAARATYYTQGGLRNPSAGLLTMKPGGQRVRPGVRLYSAAAAFAQAERHGTRAIWLALTTGEVWLAVAIDGVIQSGSDVVFSDAAHAQNALDVLRDRHEDMALFGDHPDAESLSVRELYSYCNEQSILQRPALTLSSVRPGWWLVIGALAVYVAYDVGNDWLRTERARKLAAQAAAQAGNADVLWHEAMLAWANKVPAGGTYRLLPALQAALQAPVEPGRWLLDSIECRPATWSCAATYRRGRLATNESLREAAPADWRVEYVDLNTGRYHWRISPEGRAAPHQALNLSKLPTTQDIAAIWATRWQALRPALQDLTLAPPAAVGIVPPKTYLANGQEQTLQLPAGLVLPVGQQITVSGPMRSLYGLQLPETTVIDQLSIRYQPDAQARIDNGMFMATLKGIIYVAPAR